MYQNDSFDYLKYALTIFKIKQPDSILFLGSHFIIIK